MSDDQPSRQPAGPGPDWWPRFNRRQALRWTLEGFLIPLALFVGVWIAAVIFFAVISGWQISAENVRQGGVIAMAGYFFSGGTFVLTQIFLGGLKWNTLFRIIGFTAAAIIQWKLIDVILAGI